MINHTQLIKKTIDSIINEKYLNSVKSNCVSLNSKMERMYCKLSAISHSLIPESKNNTINFFSDTDIVSLENLDMVFNKFADSINSIVNFSLIICKLSLKEWDSDNLKNILIMAFGNRKVNSILILLKS